MWDEQTSPAVKFETSPTESLLSAPGEMYPPLFSTSTSAPNTMDPMEAMTPTLSDSKQDVILSTPGATASGEAASVTSASTPADSSAEPVTPESTTSPDKKPTKKRKSWGQVLPEPKTNLPPR